MLANNIVNLFQAPAGKAKFLGQFNFTPTVIVHNNVGGNGNVNVNSNVLDDVITIVLLDVSGSMGQNVHRILSNYLPRALLEAGYTENSSITVVTFSDQARCFDITVKGLLASKRNSEGSTYMSRGIKLITSLISNAKKAYKYRIIALTDGELHDQELSVNEAKLLSDLISSSNLVVSCSAIRFATSSAQPDTRGMSALLRCSSLVQNKRDDIVDLRYDAPEATLISAISNLLTDSLGSASKLIVEGGEKVLLQTPWAEPSNEIYLSSGQNTFWLLKDDCKLFIATGPSNTEMLSTATTVGGSLDFSSYNTVLKEKIDYFMKRLRILKVINTQDSKNEIESIVSYFQQLETCFAMNEPEAAELLSTHTLQSRLVFFREVARKKARSIANQMSELANDDKVAQLNSAQQADYLRSASVSTNSKSLAKRAMGQGLNFDEIAIKEAKAMRDHISELNDIDDSDHYVSFYSQETTLEGIKTVCQLGDDELKHMSALSILQLLNIVGIPCIAAVGDFPDPKTYHLHELLLGSFVSMSDIMIVKQSGNVLRDPLHIDQNSGLKKEIVNVIPFYDDDRIQKFLMKYAPTLLEYTASIGMRNMIMNVPHTYKYTIVGGLWNMAQRLDAEKTSVNVDVFCKLVHTYKTAVDGIFDHVVKLFTKQSPEDEADHLSYFIQNNGTTNMISPFILLLEEEYNGDTTRAQFIPDAMRALYSFEYYQVTRKLFKSESDKVAMRKAYLDKLLGIDFEKYGTPIPAFFETADTKVKHHSQPHFNVDIVNDINKRIFWVDKMPILKDYILYALNGEKGKEMLLKYPQVDGDKIAALLKLNCSLDQFKIYCMVQSFMFDSKTLRVGTGKMKIQDCNYTEGMEKLLSEYIEKQYRAHYQSLLAKKEKDEREMLANELVDKMLKSQTVEEYIMLFKCGLQRNHVSVLISDSYQLGFQILKLKLFDPLVVVPFRQKKIEIFLLGAENDSIVWNKGNAVRMSLLSLNEYFDKLGLSEWWINELLPVYKAKNKYLYRDSDKANRHTHCNSKPSFWSYGYSTIAKYFAEITEAERKEYMMVHEGCCGVSGGRVVKWA